MNQKYAFLKGEQNYQALPFAVKDPGKQPVDRQAWFVHDAK